MKLINYGNRTNSSRERGQYLFPALTTAQVSDTQQMAQEPHADCVGVALCSGDTSEFLGCKNLPDEGELKCELLNR